MFNKMIFVDCSKYIEYNFKKSIDIILHLKKLKIVNYAN